MVDGWRNTIPTAKTIMPEIHTVLAGGGQTMTSSAYTFVCSFILVYLILVLLRPASVVYKEKEKNVPYFHHTNAFMWAFVAAIVSSILCHYY